jgi:uncharacterized protein YfaS (alpha-2-macroglobulin family)
VAYWSGIVDVGPEERELSYAVPDYFNGTLRVMAVAVSPDSVGVAEDRSLVRNTFIMIPNGPLSAAPGDEFEISLTVTNMQRGAGEAGALRLSLSSSPHLAITGPTEFNLAIPEGKDQTLSIPVTAAGLLGNAEIRFTASAASGQESSSLSSTMSIRPAVPYRVSLQSGAINNRNVELKVDRALYEEFHTRELNLSYLPVGLARGLSFYLNNYSYGCTEQIISAAFPFLYPQLIRDFGYTPAQAEEGIDRVIGIVQARMREDGGVGMWTSRSNSDPLITVYACHFLTEAWNAGYYVPQSLLNWLQGSLRDIASGDGVSAYSLANRAYAIYVLTLNEIVTTPLLETLKRDMDRHNKEAETEIPGLYLAGTYALLQKSADAASLLNRIKRTLRRDSSFRYIDSLLYQAVYLNILSRHFPQRLQDISESLLLSMAEQLEYQRYTTISANFALMGLDAFLKAAPAAAAPGRGEAFRVLEILRDNTRRELSVEGDSLLTGVYSAGAEAIRLENRDSLHLFYQITSAGFDREIPVEEVKNGIEVYREILDANGNALKSPRTGDELIVRLTFRTLNNQTIHDVALVDLFPAGLEPDISFIREAAENSQSWKPDYVDIREDRLVLYGTLSAQAATFSYRARAINAGLFTVPPLFAEAMYDKAVWALRPQESLRILKQED